MKKFMLPCALLIASAMLCPIAAEETPTAQEEIHDRITYGTPTVDGELDDLYTRSAKVEYKLQPWFCHEDGSLTEEEAAEKYKWADGIEASSYALWDDANIYYYFEVKDSSVGLLDMNELDPDMPNGYALRWQDGVSITLKTPGGGSATVFVERGGRIAGIVNGENLTTLSALSYDGSSDSQPNSGCYAVKNTGTGYSVELKIPLTEQAIEKTLKLGSSIEASAQIMNYIGEKQYERPENLKGAWYSEMVYGTKYDISTASLTKRYIDLVGTSSGDLNGDGSLTTLDLIRLMKNIAGRAEPTPIQDVNLDGAVDVRDLVALMKLIARS